ncbi:hypothetical protein [Saccharothrix longispora]|nr:hypothetical protein [Saccharothrix longispora]MBY8848562.1 hypothetical protein [Saccharothrix sp. MB29]MDU0287954.1 hypothetical protein [Saccharothrix longispora]
MRPISYLRGEQADRGAADQGALRRLLATGRDLLDPADDTATARPVRGTR